MYCYCVHPYKNWSIDYIFIIFYKSFIFYFLFFKFLYNFLFCVGLNGLFFFLFWSFQSMDFR